jgi:hypothetical protein
MRRCMTLARAGPYCQEMATFHSYRVACIQAYNRGLDARERMCWEEGGDGQLPARRSPV